MALQARVFEAALATQLAQAQALGRTAVEITSGDLHRSVGGYPGTDHRMPVCCRVLRKPIRAGDTIVDAPPKGNGATLTVRVRLPRH